MSYDWLNVLKPVCIECLSNKLRRFSTENKTQAAAAAATLSSPTSALTAELRSRPGVDLLLAIMRTVSEETFSPD